METIKVYSPILDTSIKKNLMNSPMWEEAYHEDEEKPSGAPMLCYEIQFEGLTPVFVSKMPD